MTTAQTQTPRKKASRNGRYRKSLLEPHVLAPMAEKVETVLNKLDQLRQQGNLSDAEFVSYGLLTLLACRRPAAFQSYRINNRQTLAPQTPGTDFNLADFWQLLCSQQLLSHSYQKILDHKISLRQFLNHVRFRGIPDAAQLALKKWLDDQYPLTLFFHVPSTTEVFELQKQGGRCLSFLKEASELTRLHHGRDSLSFVVHDLIHAHEFYVDPKKARQQIGFYHWLDGIQHHPQLLQCQAESPAFRERWEYVLSDMNSYCGHLIKTLHAAFASHTHTETGESLWSGVVDFSSLDVNEKQLFKRINSAAWNESDFLSLERVFEKRFQAANICNAF